MKRVTYFDALNVLACICVIALHCNGIAHSYSDTNAWKEALAVEVLAYWAVPVFIMLTGATTMAYRDKYDTKEFFKRRIKKTLIPFLGASVFYLFYRVIRGEYTINSIQGILSSVLNCELQTRYWFFPPLFAVYLSMPVLSVIKDNRTILWYMVGCSLVTQFFAPTLLQIFGITYNSSYAFPMTGGYLTYVILGYLLNTTEINKRERIFLYSLAIISAAIRYGVTLVLSMRDGSVNKILFSYTNFVALFMSIAIFVFLNILDWKK